MPTSDVPKIPYLINLVGHFHPRSILDIGIGCGKYGMLFREYLDINLIPGPQCTHRGSWKMRIDGVEGFAEYVTEVHHALYDQIYLGNITKLVEKLPEYDVIFMAEVIEHIDKEEGRKLLDKLFIRTNKAIVLSTPEELGAQESVHGNQLEEHRSVWNDNDLRGFPSVGCITKNETFIAAICKPPYNPPWWLGKPVMRRRIGIAVNAIARVFFPSIREVRNLPDWPILPAR